MALTLASLEYSALAAERTNTLQSLREAREHRRLLLRVLGDFERSIAKGIAEAEKTPAAAKRELDDYYARMVARDAAE